MRLTIHVVAILAVVLPHGALAAKLSLLDASIYPLARCMDGSPGGYYLEEAISADAQTSWVIELQGGGECASQKLCDSKKNSPLFSSKYFPTSTNLRFLASGDHEVSPRLYAWNRVHVAYCSQDLWMGTRTRAARGSPSDGNPNATFGYYFSGHLILDAVLKDLENSHGLGNAERIVLTGESAGGIGVWPNLDWIAQRYPSSRVVGAPIAGFYFFAYPFRGPGHTKSSLANFEEQAWPQHYSLWKSFVDEDCRRALGSRAYACSLANYSYPYVESETFVVESQTDKVVIDYHDWVPASQDPNWSPEVRAYLQDWKANMTGALRPWMSAQSKNGVFNPSCFIHTDFSADSPLINKTSYYQAFDAWFHKENGDLWKLQDDCGILCNPTCQH